VLEGHEDRIVLFILRASLFFPISNKFKWTEFSLLKGTEEELNSRDVDIVFGETLFSIKVGEDWHILGLPEGSLELVV
jgi:hypothetical protein